MQRILVVDDLAIVRDPIAAALSGAGYETLCAATGSEAIGLIQSKLPNLVLLDIHLPDMSGLKILQLMRGAKATANVPVILLSADERRDCIIEAAKLGAQGYVIKSHFSLRDLLARIAEQLKNPVRKPQPAAPPASAAPKPAAKPSPVPQQPEMTVSEQLQSIKVIVTREHIMEQVDRCTELKALSPTVAQLVGMTGSADCSLDQLAKVIKRDQAISLKVLKVANSVVYNRGDPVDTVQKALSRIGVAQIRQTVLNISVIDNFSATQLGESFSPQLFWEHSISTALIAASIARYRHQDDRQIDNAFTMGLVHDVARMVFAEQMGENYKQVLETATRLQLPLEQVETRMLLLNHADLMDRILTAWNFPKVIVEAIGMHHLSAGNIRNLSPQLVSEVSTLALANRLSHAMLLGSSGNDAMYPTEEFFDLLELKPDDIKRIETDIPEQTTDMKYAMLQSSADTKWPDHRQQVLKQFKRPIRPLFISRDPEIDGYRMLFDRLSATSNNCAPNIAVVHLTGVRDRDSLSELLLKTEKERNLKPLSLIIISPNGLLKLGPRVVDNRVHRLVPSPFTLSRLAEATNAVLEVAIEAKSAA